MVERWKAMTNDPAEVVPWFLTVLDSEKVFPGAMAVVAVERAEMTRSGSKTVSVVLPLILPDVAVIVVVPAPRPAAKPAALIVAIDGLLLLQTTVEAAVVIPVTANGVGEKLMVPFPSWPYVLSPQHFDVPSESTEQV